MPCSNVEYFTMSSAWAWVYRGSLWCAGCPALSLCRRSHIPVVPTYRPVALTSHIMRTLRETRLGAAPALGQTTLRPHTVRFSALTWHWGCHHLPAWPCLRPPEQACERHVFWLLQFMLYYAQDVLWVWWPVLSSMLLCAGAAGGG